jgi:hypothetical protein
MNIGNNGGYANDWLLGDRKTGEIARFEQGLKHTRLWTTIPQTPAIRAGTS